MKSAPRTKGDRISHCFLASAQRTIWFSPFSCRSRPCAGWRSRQSRRVWTIGLGAPVAQDARETCCGEGSPVHSAASAAEMARDDDSLGPIAQQVAQAARRTWGSPTVSAPLAANRGARGLGPEWRRGGLAPKSSRRLSARGAGMRADRGLAKPIRFTGRRCRA